MRFWWTNTPAAVLLCSLCGVQPLGPVLLLPWAGAPALIPPWPPQLIVPNFQPCALHCHLQRWLVRSLSRHRGVGGVGNIIALAFGMQKGSQALTRS